MGRPLGNMHKTASFCLAHFAACHDFQLSFDDIKGLVLVVMDMGRWASIRWHHTF